MVILGWGRDAWATEKSLVVLGIIAPISLKMAVQHLTPV
jgi:hypothetical protein